MNESPTRTKWQWIPSRVEGAVFICPRCAGLVQMECMGDHQDWHRRTEGD